MKVGCISNVRLHDSLRTKKSFQNGRKFLHNAKLGIAPLIIASGLMVSSPTKAQAQAEDAWMIEYPHDDSGLFGKVILGSLVFMVAFGLLGAYLEKKDESKKNESDKNSEKNNINDNNK